MSINKKRPPLIVRNDVGHPPFVRSNVNFPSGLLVIVITALLAWLRYSLPEFPYPLPCYKSMFRQWCRCTRTSCGRVVLSFRRFILLFSLCRWTFNGSAYQVFMCVLVNGFRNAAPDLDPTTGPWKGRRFLTSIITAIVELSLRPWIPAYLGMLELTSHPRIWKWELHREPFPLHSDV